MNHTPHNCWEYKECGREPGGNNVRHLGVCPAAIDESFDGINGGSNGGRICWAVAGTLCEGKRQGEFLDKRPSCLKCDFFLHVGQQQGRGNRSSTILKFLTETKDASFLEELSFKRVRAGERFIVQGQVEDTAYLIGEGTCLTIVEKDGHLFPTGHWSRGDVVGISGLFTGEPRQAHVEAETEMQLWVLTKHQIDSISSQHPELLALITEIVASQFDSKRPVANRQIGKYLTTEIIGRGAHALVYKAIHSHLQMVVAIKMMRHHLALDASFLRNFQREAQIIASLNHENILRVYDYEQRYRTVFIISEYLEGESLRSLLNRLGTIPVPLLLRFLRQICDGLAYAHGKGIIHRDITPDNIMVLAGDHTKILDFGLACSLGGDDEHIGGALPYQAPELLEGNPADCRTDIYALGITLFELANGQKPFTNKQLTTFLQTGEPRRLPEPAVSDQPFSSALQRITAKACQHHPAERYQSVVEMAREVYSLLGHPLEISLPRDETTTRATFTLRFRDDQRQSVATLLQDIDRRAKELRLNCDLAFPESSDPPPNTSR